MLLWESNLYIFLNFDTSKWLVSSHFTLYHTQIPHDYHTKVPFDLITFPLTIPKSYLTCSHTRVPPGPLPYPSPTWPFTIPKLHHLILSKKNPAWASTTQFPPDYWYEKSHPTLSKVPPNPLSYNSIWLFTIPKSKVTDKHSDTYQNRLYLKHTYTLCRKQIKVVIELLIHNKFYTSTDEYVPLFFKLSQVCSIIFKITNFRINKLQ